MRSVKTWLMTVVLVLGMAALGMAQEAGEMNFTYGKIFKITGNEIGVLVYDFNVHEEVEEVYVADSGTVFEGVESIGNLVVGDDVDIEYIEADGMKTIKNLYRTMIEEGVTEGVVVEEAEEINIEATAGVETAEEIPAVEEAEDIQAMEDTMIQDMDEAEEVQDIEDVQDLEMDEVVEDAQETENYEEVEEVQDLQAAEEM